MYFKPFHQMNFDKSMDKSNYEAAVVAPETCKACALCVKRCPVDSIQLRFSTKATNKFGKAVVVDTELCIGCGVCVHKCKTKSIILKKKEDITRPPRTGRDLVTLNAMAAMAAKEKQAQE